MYKALFKKQLMEVNTWLYQNKKTGTRRSKGGMSVYLLLYIFIFGSLGVVFFGVGTMLCEPLWSLGLNWLYFSIMGLISMMLGVFGSVFNTYATLYKAKDNELLLSMPIKPVAILFAKLFGVWLWSFIYEALVFFPALLVYWLKISHGFSSVFFGLTLLISISFLVLTLACILGWIVAKISAKLKNKNIITVIVSLAFFALYYLLYFKANKILQSILVNAAEIGEKIKGSAYPLYLMGMMGSGDAFSAFIFILCVAAVFAVVFIVLSRSFISLATTEKGTKKKEYKKTISKVRKIETALLFKEFKRFTASPTYMLNCSLGVVIMLIGAVAVLIKGGDLFSMLLLNTQIDPKLLPLISCAVICMTASMNDITAPSVSLEGKNIWLVQSLPVLPVKILEAKLKLHLIITEIPVFIFAVCCSIAFKFNVLQTILIVLVTFLFVLFSASYGLAVNLKSPNLTWTDETVPIKQSLSSMISMFGSWLFVMLVAGLYFLLKDLIAPTAYLIICIFTIGTSSLAVILWIRKRGAQIFAGL